MNPPSLQEEVEKESMSEMARVLGPGLAWRSGKVGVACGILGALTGSTLALLRRSPTPTLFALATSIQWTLLGSTYHFTRQSALIYQSHRSGHDVWSLRSWQKERASAFAGGVAGVVGGAVRGSVVNMGAGAVVCAGLGFVGERVVAGFRAQDGDDVEEVEKGMLREGRDIAGDARMTRAMGEKMQFQRQKDEAERRQQQGEQEEREETGLIGRMARSRWNPMRRLTDQEYEDMLKEKLIRVEAEIAIVDEEVAKLEGMKVREERERKDLQGEIGSGRGNGERVT